MGLKQDIVIVNEYTIKTADGGTRGSTPGEYVLRYMARDGAVEPMAPVLVTPMDTYVTKYMLRADAVEAWPNDPVSAKQQMARSQGFAGKAFGCEGGPEQPELSFSHHTVKAVAKKIQSLYDDEHTVLKTVISFSDDYAERMGLLRHSFKHRKKGDWEGNIDEARIRSAICAGMTELSEVYDDLVWIGCVQVDASKVHCHLCAVDAGEGTIMDDGYQRGTIPASAMMNLRRAISDDFLRTLPMKQFSDEVQRDRQDVKTFVKELTHTAMAENGAPQFIIACLPSDRNLWHTDSSSQEMKRANIVTRLYVREILQDERSGYRNALSEVYTSAREHAKSPEEERQLVSEGENRLVNDCVEAVYNVLRDLPEEELQIQTPILDVMACDFEELAKSRGQDPLLEFGLKLRSYSSRLEYHQEKRRQASELANAWEEARDAGQVSEDSHALYDFYRYEEEYNELLVSKYAHFLSFLPLRGKQKKVIDNLQLLRHELSIFLAFLEDGEFLDLASVEDAITYASEVYGIDAGDLYFKNPNLISEQLEIVRDELTKSIEEVSRDLNNVGLALVENSDGTYSIADGNLYPFDDVKALDLHHLDYDFTYDVHISRPNVEAFLLATGERSQALNRAIEYLEGSGQQEFIKDLPVTDVQLMVEKARRLASNQTIAVQPTTEAGISHAHPTISLDKSIEDELIAAIRESARKTLAEADRGFVS